MGAAVARDGRQPRHGALVALGLVDVAGDGDQLGAGEVVGELPVQADAPVGEKHHSSCAVFEAVRDEPYGAWPWTLLISTIGPGRRPDASRRSRSRGCSSGATP